LELGRLVFEHPEFIVVDKPAGVSVHKDLDQSGYLMAWSAARNEPLWLVHRLDKMTSGLLLLGRTQSAAAQLSQLFALREVEKLYLAISASKPRRKQGMIRGDMQSARRGSWKLLRTEQNPAATEYVSRGVGQGRRLFLCHPLTGKTHQIRVALKSEGAPILGDSRYATGSAANADRGYLHAWQLGFEFFGECFRFRADPSSGEWFDRALQQGELEALLGENLPAHWQLRYLPVEP